MNYRVLGKTGLKVSPIGMGAMRLPMLDGKQGYTGFKGSTLDVEKSTNIIRHAIDSGINYLDVAYNYLDGDSEVVVGKALLDGYREKTVLVTKSPIWLFKEPDDFGKYLNIQLERLQTDHIDIYLLHSLGKASWEKKALKHNLLQKLDEAKADGRIRFAGFSFHDNFENFETILNAYNWDLCQIQLNYYDENFQAGVKGLELAAAKGIAVSIMEPLRGGYLAKLPNKALDIVNEKGKGKTAAELSFDWLWNKKEVGIVLSGMGSIEQVDENISYAEKSEIGMLSDDDLKIYDEIKDALNSYDTVKCTGCNYCNICPKHIAIPYAFQVYNWYKSENEARAIDFYKNQFAPFGAYPDNCIGCKACEERCPQHINISEWMPKIGEMFKD